MVVVQSNRALAMDNGAGVGAAVPAFRSQGGCCAQVKKGEEEDGGPSGPVSYSEVVVRACAQVKRVQFGTTE